MRIKQNFAVLVSCVLFLSFLSASAFGAVFNVTDTAGFATALTTAAANSEADTINVAAGTYDVTSTLTYGSAPPTEEFTLTIQGAGADDTILKGNHDRIMSITANGAVSIDGLTFLNGMACGTSDPDFKGGGLYVYVLNADLTVTNCVFQENYANESGGGVYVLNSGTTSGTTTFDNNVFILNSADNCGGGLYVWGRTDWNHELILRNNLFLGNEARRNHGGGAYVDAGGYASAASIVEKNTFRYNYAGGDGGGLYAGLGSYQSLSQYGGTVRNNLFLNNWAVDQGGGAYFNVNISGTCKVINNTCIENAADVEGGGFYFYLRDNTDTEGWDVIAHIYNNIIGDNNAETGAEFYINDYYLEGFSNVATVYLYNNDYHTDGLYVVDGSNLTASDNIDVNPNIVVWGDLAYDSPCIDAGIATYAPSDDIHGEARPNGTAFDIGADEFYDTDEDGLPDYWETLTGETEPGADPDEDGMDNLTEYERGLDPVVPVYDASGEWDITVSSVETDCPDMDIEDTTVTITQEEGNITLEVDGEIFTGEFNGFDSTYYLGSVQTEEGLTITFRMAFSLTTESSGSGTVSWIVTDGSNDLVCDGSAEFTMEPADSDDDDDDGFCFIQTAR
jgi:predicted outer membrane repeat protein